jgi:hypothetical protein
MTDSPLHGEVAAQQMKSTRFPRWLRIVIPIILTCFGCIALTAVLLPKFKAMMGNGKVNTDGFACSAVMAINMSVDVMNGKPTTPQIPCDEDIKKPFRTSLTSYNTIGDWYVAESNSFLQRKDLPLEMRQVTEYENKNNYVFDNLRAGTSTIAVVVLPNFTHTVVIVGHDDIDGFYYLDSLTNDGHLPNEKDFLANYAVKFQDAWLYTFEIKQSK